jgi:hypothetical protein
MRSLQLGAGVLLVLTAGLQAVLLYATSSCAHAAQLQHMMSSHRMPVSLERPAAAAPQAAIDNPGPRFDSGTKQQQQQQLHVTAPERSNWPFLEAAAGETAKPLGPVLRFLAAHWLAFAEADAAAHGALPSSACDDSHGRAFLQRWQQRHGVLCAAPPALSNPVAWEASSVSCWGFLVADSGVACEAHSMVVNTAAFMALDPHQEANNRTTCLLGCLALCSSAVQSMGPMTLLQRAPFGRGRLPTCRGRHCHG